MYHNHRRLTLSFQNELDYMLCEPIFVRTTEGNARVAVLFSGGIDSTVLAYFAHKYMVAQHYKKS